MAEEAHITTDGTLFFDAKKCIHSRNCVLNRPDVFVPNVEGEWIHPERASTDELHAIADNCPSGAIRFVENDKPAKTPLINSLHIRENGPYALKATVQMDGEPENATNVTLCRCGASKNKPYCDGSHSAIPFISTGEVKTLESEPLASRNGVIIVKPAKNGPLFLYGNLEVCSGTGRTVNRAEEVHLCRCGHSKNKPYCDGTHAKIGFNSEE